MNNYKRLSPITFEATPEATESRDGWEVVLTYRDERDGPALVDLSHCAKWDLQDGKLSELEPGGLKIPAAPGACLVAEELIVSRLNRTQASIWHFEGAKPVWPDVPALTETTDAYALVAVIGQETLRITEKVSALDLTPPDKKPPFSLLGPVLYVPMQLVVMGSQNGPDGVLLACSRGYGQCVVETLLDAGGEFGLKPAGEKRFVEWMQNILSA